MEGITRSVYKQHHSTETALIKIFNDILCAVDKKQCVLLVLLDLSAAFDTKAPSDWKNFLSNSENKQDLPEFVFKEWSSDTDGRYVIILQGSNKYFYVPWIQMPTSVPTSRI